MYLPRVQHRMHISGRNDGHEGGRLPVMAHGGGGRESGVMVAPQLPLERGGGGATTRRAAAGSGGAPGGGQGRVVAAGEREGAVLRLRRGGGCLRHC